jgi:hypothetical protein
MENPMERDMSPRYIGCFEDTIVEAVLCLDSCAEDPFPHKFPSTRINSRMHYLTKSWADANVKLISCEVTFQMAENLSYSTFPRPRASKRRKPRASISEKVKNIRPVSSSPWREIKFPGYIRPKKCSEKV